VRVTETEVRSILTRTSGYLKNVTSHSMQPYRGCTYGNSLCGVGCYVQHNRWLTRGAAWGSFLEVRSNAAEAYRRQHAVEQKWARRARGRFSVFFSSSTDPFVPQEKTFGITRSLLEAMNDLPPDQLIIQTHTHLVSIYSDLYLGLTKRCDLRFHISIESDRDCLPGLPSPASSVEKRFEAAAALHDLGLRVVITVSPLLPIRGPHRFFQRIATVANGVVIDHFIGGDGTPDGSRTLATDLPRAMSEIDPDSVGIAYRERMVAIATEIMPGRVGVSVEGFAGRFLPGGGS
jgi:DNA repair photolyase